MASGIVGRDAELAFVRAFVGSIADGAAALVLEGEAGMGKTTLWSAGLVDARGSGLSVVSARPAESETTLSFSAIGDLLDPVLDHALERLVPAQRRALGRALVLDDTAGPTPDPHAVGVAVLNAMRAVAAEAPLVVAIDDVQWLDAASSGALAYAARRLSAEPVGLLLARRSRLESSLVSELRRSVAPGRFQELLLGPLGPTELHRVVQEHLETTLPRPLLAEVHQASGGNPFYALEIVRMLQRTGVSVEAGHPLPLPDSLRELVHERLLALPPESRDFLLAVAAHASPTVQVTEAASGVSRGVGLAPALEARVVEVDRDRIHFTHPLLAAGAYETGDALRRAEIHVRLAELLQDPEARAWQLAAATDRPDEQVARALEDAAAHARARGAPRPAALLLDRARELTPADEVDSASRRAIDAAYLHFESGDSRRADAQLADVIARLPFGEHRARALVRLARVHSYRALSEAAELFAQAIQEAGDDRETLAIAHEGVATCLFRMRSGIAAAMEHADLSARLALELGDDALAAEALGSKLLAETVLGLESAGETTEQAVALEDAATDRRVLAQPLWAVCGRWWWTDEHERARGAIRELLQRGLELGDESSAPYTLALTGFLDCLLGDYGPALEDALEGQELARQSGQPLALAYNFAVEGLAWAECGAPEKARAAAHRALALVPETAARFVELVARWALGHVELAVGDATAAIANLAPNIELVHAERFGEPGAMRFVVDYVEALVEVGRTEEAEQALDWYESNAQRLERVSALANCLRCRGLLAAQAGDLEEALAAFDEALGWHERVEIPLDRGRTLLGRGATQRRSKRRREARATLEQALAIFERIGAALWAQRAHAELRRISGRAPSVGALTPAEERVAALVAEGKTNREVAAALFLSDRTVEGHLSRVFGKLGIGHRAELAGALAARQTQGDAAPNAGDVPVSAAPSAP